MHAMHIRAPDIQPDQGELVWSRVPEFSLAYNSYSVVIPYVEYYLNSIMNRVRSEHCADRAQLKAEIDTFVKQEINHSRYHVLYNKRMFEIYPSLKPVVERLAADLKRFRETRSLAFNIAYCAGFESIATYDAQRLHTACDDLFEGADPHGANLLLWHVAEEFEHRTVCHEAFHAVSGDYFLRIYGVAFGFWHVGGYFMQAKRCVLEQHWATLAPAERKASQRRERKLFWRQMLYMLPRMLKIFLPGYDPAKLKVPARIEKSLAYFGQPGPLRVAMLEATA